MVKHIELRIDEVYRLFIIVSNDMFITMSTNFKLLQLFCYLFSVDQSIKFDHKNINA